MTQASEEPRGLKGWLLLVGLGITLSPVRILWDLFKIYLPAFTDGTWSVYTDPASPDYTPHYGSSVVIETLLNVALFLYALLVAFLFYSKSRFFPKLYIGLLLTYSAFTIASAWLRTWPYPDEAIFSEETIPDIFRSFIPCAIWIPYMLLSKRVRNTFVAVPLEEDEEPV